MANREDLTHCVICFEEYDKEEKIPRLLSCTHTLCQSCLYDLIGSAKNLTFKCPECRISHEITEKGVKEYPQNKYILSHLEKIEKAKPQAGCVKHNRPVALFCSEEKCRKSLCAMCYIEEHRTHSVTDFVQEAQKCKQNVIGTVETRLKVLDKRRELLKEIKSNLLESSSNSLCELNKRQKCLMDQIVSEFQLIALIITSHRDKELQNLKQKIYDLDERSLKLVNLMQEVNTSSDTSIIENFQKEMEKCKEITSTMVTEESQMMEAVYRNYNSTCYETAETDTMISKLIGNTVTTCDKVEAPGLNSILTEAAGPSIISKPHPPQYNAANFEAQCGSKQKEQTVRPPPGTEYLKLMRKFKTDYQVMNVVHVLDNSTLVLAGEDHDGGNWVVNVDQVGNVTWTKQIECEPAGITSIILASTPCIVIAYSGNCVIDFHVMKHQDTILYSLDVKEHQPGYLATRGDILAFVDVSTTPQSLKLVNCSCFPPMLIETSESLPLPESLIVGLCLAEKAGALIAIVSTDQALSAFDAETGNALWQVSGCVGNSKEALYPWGVCADHKGHLFVADRSNDCVHLLSTDGSFLKTVLDELPYVQELSLDQSHERLIVQHEDAESSDSDSSCQISTFQIAYKASSSNLGKLVGNIFGSAFGDLVEDGIDTLKYGFSDSSHI